jgi:hypothetical protein
VGDAVRWEPPALAGGSWTLEIAEQHAVRKSALAAGLQINIDRRTFHFAIALTSTKIPQAEALQLFVRPALDAPAID